MKINGLSVCCIATVLQLWVSKGSRGLLESTYWRPEVQKEYAALKELDNELLDFLTLALATPWRRPSAAELAAHKLFSSVGTQDATTARCQTVFDTPCQNECRLQM